MTYNKPLFPFYDDENDYNTNAPSFYDYLAKQQKLIKKLATRIWEYDERLDKRLEDLENVLQGYLTQWDERIENLDKEVEHILRGYENIIEKLKNVGADIVLVDE